MTSELKNSTTGKQNQIIKNRVALQDLTGFYLEKYRLVKNKGMEYISHKRTYINII